MADEYAQWMRSVRGSGKQYRLLCRVAQLLTCIIALVSLSDCQRETSSCHCECGGECCSVVPGGAAALLQQWRHPPEGRSNEGSHVEVEWPTEGKIVTAGNLSMAGLFASCTYLLPYLLSHVDLLTNVGQPQRYC